jgi:hypothetical protein
LGEAGYQLAPDGERVWSDAPYPSRAARNLWIRRKLGSKGYVSHIATLAAASVMKDFVALHMTWGAVNELTTLTAYHRLIAKTEHPVLVELLNRIIKDERRHFAFYRAQARVRLGRSRQARRVVRWALQHLWAPAGTGVRPQQETDFTIAFLFDDAEGRVAARHMDQTIGELPGLAGLTVTSDALRSAARRIGPAVAKAKLATPLAAFRT